MSTKKPSFQTPSFPEKGLPNGGRPLNKPLRSGYSPARTQSVRRLLDELRQNCRLDDEVLEAIANTPRDIFVPDILTARAWEDTALPVECDQWISQPTIVAKMTQILEPRTGRNPETQDRRSRLRVLEIGTGTGYQSAILAQLFRNVYSVERHKELLDLALMRFARLRLRNIHTKWTDGKMGWAEQAPFERIIVTAAAEHMPEPLFEQLAEGGIMVIPLCVKNAGQRLFRYRKKEGKKEAQDLGGVRFVPLVSGLAQARRK